jgi:hypothetical protein
VLAVIVALAVQGAWEIAHRLLIENGLGHDHYVSSYGVAIDTATYSMIAIAAFDAARRLVLARKLGVQIAAWASLAVVAVLLVGTPIAFLVPRDGPAYANLFALADDVWLGLEIIAIVGFAIASGRRGAWLGVIAIGFVLLRQHPDAFIGLGLRVGFTALVLGERVLIAVMVLEIGRLASPPKPDPDRAVRALRRLELVAWFDVAYGLVDIGLRVANVAQIDRALAWVGVSLFTGAIALSAFWSLVRAAIPRMPRWSWVLAAICVTTMLARTFSVWFGTFARWWGRLDEAPLKPPHWIVGVPAFLAVLVGLVSLAVFARRTDSRELVRAAVIASGLAAIEFAAPIAIGPTGIAVLVLYIARAGGTALAYRSARPVVYRAVKLTDVFS